MGADFDNVIPFASTRISRARERAGQYCEHRHLAYHYPTESIQCKDCGHPIGAFKAFMQLVRQHELAWDELKARRQEVMEARSQVLHLLAAKAVERALRNRKMVPTCPHCFAGLFPEELLHLGAVNREFEEQRRKRNLKAGGPVSRM